MERDDIDSKGWWYTLFSSPGLSLKRHMVNLHVDISAGMGFTYKLRDLRCVN